MVAFSASEPMEDAPTEDFPTEVGLEPTAVPTEVSVATEVADGINSPTSNGNVDDESGDNSLEDYLKTMTQCESCDRR